MILYKSIPENKISNDFKFAKNIWYKVDSSLVICSNGFHASENIINAMNFVNCGWIAKVEVRGESIIQYDKQCWSEMRIIEWHKWTKKDSISLAIYAAELVLNNFEKKYPDDKRPREAIGAAKEVLKNDIEKNRSAAWSAARSAAESATWSAESAESAAWSAAWSADSAAASAAILQKCHNFIIKRKFNL